MVWAESCSSPRLATIGSHGGNSRDRDRRRDRDHGCRRSGGRRAKKDETRCRRCFSGAARSSRCRRGTAVRCCGRRRTSGVPFPGSWYAPQSGRQLVRREVQRSGSVLCRSGSAGRAEGGGSDRSPFVDSRQSRLRVDVERRARAWRGRRDDDHIARIARIEGRSAGADIVGFVWIIGIVVDSPGFAGTVELQHAGCAGCVVGDTARLAERADYRVPGGDDRRRSGHRRLRAGDIPDRHARRLAEFDLLRPGRTGVARR